MVVVSLLSLNLLRMNRPKYNNLICPFIFLESTLIDNKLMPSDRQTEELKKKPCQRCALPSFILPVIRGVKRPCYPQLGIADADTKSY